MRDLQCTQWEKILWIYLNRSLLFIILQNGNDPSCNGNLDVFTGLRCVECNIQYIILINQILFLLFYHCQKYGKYYNVICWAYCSTLVAFISLNYNPEHQQCTMRYIQSSQMIQFNLFKIIYMYQISLISQVQT